MNQDQDPHPADEAGSGAGSADPGHVGPTGDTPPEAARMDDRPPGHEATQATEPPPPAGEPAATTAGEAGRAAHGPAEAAAGSAPGAPRGTAAPAAPPPPMTQREVLRAIRAQWRDRDLAPDDARLGLVRTIDDHPSGIPVAALRPRLSDPDLVFDAWESAQLASDATPIGLALRPRLSLVPVGGRWYVRRSAKGVTWIVTIGRSNALRALWDADLRFRARVVDPEGELDCEFATGDREPVRRPPAGLADREPALDRLPEALPAPARVSTH